MDKIDSNMIKDVEPLLNTHEAAKYLKISSGTMTNWRNRKRGPAYIKVGNNIRYQISDLQEWIKRQRVEI